MKSYIENERKRNKIPKNFNITKESNCGPIYWQATAVPVNQLAIRLQGCKAQAAPCYRIYTAHMSHALSRAAYIHLYSQKTVGICKLYSNTKINNILK